MTIKINYIKDSSTIKKERVVLRVLTDDELGLYFLFKTTENEDNTVANSVSNPFWFPDKTVKAGDLVVIYSREGTPSEVKNKSGSTTHFFYLDSPKTIWNKSSDCAVLLECKSWEVRSVGETEETDEI
jgi:hypothetical protein